jgi:hypothetical protein
MKRKIATYGCRPIPGSGLKQNLDGNVGTYCDQIAELKVSSKAACLARNAFHQTTVPKECYPIEGSVWDHLSLRRALTIGVIVDEVKTLLVINRP